MSTLAERVLLARENKNMTQQEVADAVGMKQPSYYKIESGKTQRTKFINELAKVLNVSVDWLATGEGEPTVKKDGFSNRQPIEDWDSDTPLSPDEVEIPFYKSLKFACGHGSDSQPKNNETRKLRMSRLTLKRLNTQQKNVFSATAEGDSMTPIIHDGNTIFVDTDKKTIKDGKIFAISHGGLQACKRLYNLPNGGVRIVSDNKEEFEEVRLTKEQIKEEDFFIIGWVFSWSVLEKW